MTRICPQCGASLPRLRNGLQLLRSRASASEWHRLAIREIVCPGCQAVLRLRTTRAGWLLLVGGMVAIIPALILMVRFPLHPQWSLMAILLYFLLSIPFSVWAGKRSSAWKLIKPGTGTPSMPSVNGASVPPGPGPARDWIDRALTGAFVLSVLLSVASWALLLVPRAMICQPGFWRPRLLWQNGSPNVPQFWIWLTLMTWVFRQTRRPRALKLRISPAPRWMSVWSLAGLVAMTILSGLDGFTRFQGSSWFEVTVVVSWALFLPGTLGILIVLLRGRKARGMPILSAREKTMLALLAVIVLVVALLPKWML